MPDVPGDTVDTALASVVEAIESAHRQLSSSKTGQTASAIVNKIYFSYKFPNYRDGTTGCHRVPVQEVLHYNSKALLQVLDRSKYENHDILGYLEQLAKTKFSPIAIKMSDFPYPLIHRKQMVRNSKKPVLERSSDVSVTSEEATSGQPIRQARGGKQVKTRAGKKSGLRLPTSSAKRPHADLESGSESENSAAKKSHFFSEDDGVEDAADTSAEGGEDTSDNGERPSTDPVKIFIRAEKIPSSVPRGLHDTWTCEQQGCDYIVRGGEEEECQDRIREHFRDHEESKRVDLAVTESRGLLPIKYAYFPPFLILVEFDSPDSEHTLPQAGGTTVRSAKMSKTTTAQPRTEASSGAQCNASGPSGPDKQSFRRLLTQYRRRPRPVSDMIGALTRLQSPSRED